MFASRIVSTARIIYGRHPILNAKSSSRLFSTIRPVSPMSALRQTQITSSLVSPTQSTTNSPILSSLAALQSSSIFSNLLGGQRRWKSRGNNYQPNTYKRKKTLGFMSRMRSKTGRKIIARRRAKGRWYLSH